ncbi:MAG: DUF504 domain-containing protein [Candidatus Thermoplasmatota archaeon]|nr:DUF504 domain-containing protein [Candidatus Thermoplasmatota archaeon]
MVSVREVLNKILWSGDFSSVEIWYVHRGAPNNVRVIKGTMIDDVGRSFIQIGDSMIPHHRVFRILYDNRVVFDRPPKP